MEWLMHNLVADMRGADFLKLYAVVIVATVAICSLLFHQRDPTRRMSVPPIPTDLDPYEVAYLRGGENEVIRVAILDLIQRGYLSRDGSERIRRAFKPPDPRHLTQLERTVFSWLAKSKSADEIFAGGELQTLVGAFCKGYDEVLHREKLLLPRESAAFRDKLLFVGLVIILGLGGYKFAVALAKGRYNVGFLIGMAIVSSVALILCATQLLPRASKRGRAYVERLQEVFDQVRARASRVRESVSNDDLLMLASVYGVGVLAGTMYDYYPKLFKRADTTSSSGGCGSGGCGSSCGSGCGGGGGCGGCGS